MLQTLLPASADVSILSFALLGKRCFYFCLELISLITRRFFMDPTPTPMEGQKQVEARGELIVELGVHRTLVGTTDEW